MTTPEEFDELYPDAYQQNAPLGRLTEAKSRQLVARCRVATLNALGVGGSKQEVCRRGREAVRRSDTVRTTVELYGEQQFHDLMEWMYRRLHGQREGGS